MRHWKFAVMPPIQPPAAEDLPPPVDLHVRDLTLQAELDFPLLGEIHTLINRYLLHRGSRPKFLLLSYMKYKQLAAEMSTAEQRPILPEVVEGLVPIIVPGPLLGIAVSGYPVDDFHYWAQQELYPKEKS